MSPIETLRAGILEGDWPLVCKAHQLLTGEKLVPPADDVPRDVAKAVAGLDAALREWGRTVPEPPEAVAAKPVGPTKPARPAKPAKPTKTPKSPRPAKPTEVVPKPIVADLSLGRGPVPRGLPNRFVDDVSVGRDDLEIDRKLLVGVSPSQRRPPAQKAKVVCNGCNKEHLVYRHNLPRPLDAEDAAPKFYCDGCVAEKASRAH